MADQDQSAADHFKLTDQDQSAADHFQLADQVQSAADHFQSAGKSRIDDSILADQFKAATQILIS